VQCESVDEKRTFSSIRKIMGLLKRLECFIIDGGHKLTHVLYIGNFL